MKSARTVVVMLAALGAAFGCSYRSLHPPLLLGDAAAVCGTGPGLVVSARPDGRFAVNHGVFDRRAFGQAIRALIGPRPDKVVMVRSDSMSAGTLGWVITSIRQAGGRAYEFDPACVHARSPAIASFVSPPFQAGVAAAGR